MFKEVFTTSLIRLAWVFTCVLACASGARAATPTGTVMSDFVMQLDNSIFNSGSLQLSSFLSGDKSFAIDDMSIPYKGVPIKLTGLQASLHYKFISSSPQISLGNVINLVSTELSASITIDHLSVCCSITETNGNITETHNFSADCTDIKVELPLGTAQAMGSLLMSLDANGLPTISFPYLNANWTNAWSVSAVSCTGSAGFDTQVRSGLPNYLNNVAQVLPTLKAKINKELLKLQTQLRQELLEGRVVDLGIPNVVTTVYPTNFQAVSGNRFQLRGTVAFAFPSAKQLPTLTVTESSAVPTQAGYVISLPQALIPALNDMAYRTGFMQGSELGSKIAAFTNLRGSMDVAFVWPELTAIDNSRDIQFTFLANSEPQLRNVTANAKGALVGQIAGDLKVNTFVQNANGAGYAPFVHFDAPIAGTFQLSIANGLMTALLAPSSFQLLPTWDPTYPVAFSTAINTDPIVSNITSALQTTGASFALGSFDLFGLKLAPSTLAQTGKWFLVDLAKK